MRGVVAAGHPVSAEAGARVLRAGGNGSWGTHGAPAGICAASERFGSVPLAELTGHAASLARDGLEVNEQQAYLAELLAPINRSSPEAAAAFLPGGAPPRVGDI